MVFFHVFSFQVPKFGGCHHHILNRRITLLIIIDAQVTTDLKKVFRGIFHSAKQKHSDPDKAHQDALKHIWKFGPELKVVFFFWGVCVKSMQ